MIVFDTDILSMFAKIDAIDLLKRLFDNKTVMTPKIRDEVKQILERIKDADNLAVSREVEKEIFEE